MSDTRRYAVWPNPRSRSRMSEMRENGRFQNISTNMHAVKRLTVNYDAPRIAKLQPDRFLIFILIRRHVTFKLRVFHKQILPFMRSRLEVPYRDYLYMMWLYVKVPFTAANQIQVHHEWSLKWFCELSDLCISRGCQLVILLMSAPSSSIWPHLSYGLVRSKREYYHNCSLVVFLCSFL